MEANPRLRLSETAKTLRSCTGEDHFDYLCQHGCSPVEVADEIEEYLRCSTLTDHLVTEVCPYCESEIEMRWSVKDLGYKATCPVCGNRLMLCDECRPRGPGREPVPGGCDYDSESDTCKFNDVGDTPGLKAELRFILEFARERDFLEEVERRQLRALWSAYCLRHDRCCDTRPYDEELLELWNEINKNADAVAGDADWSCYERFDLYMGQDIS